MRMVFATMLLIVATLPASAQQVAGLYEIHQMEMAGGLELGPDGRFRYRLEYGAASEEAEGRWVAGGDRVLLTSDPMPKAPVFEVIRDEAAPAGELWVELAPPGFGDFTTSLQMLVTLKGGTVGFVEADAAGRVLLDGGTPVSIRPIVPVYGDVSEPIPLSADTGHRLLLRFVPNDLGRARFRGETLMREGDTLVLSRYKTKVVFRPVQPRPR
jgi:hypothetical protein